MLNYLSKEKIGKIMSFLTSRFFTVVVMVILLLLLLKQCNENKYLEAEAKREHNNYLASLDSVRTIKNELGHIIQEKSAYQLKVSELSKEQKELIGQLDLKSNGKGSTPKAVVQIVTEYKDSIVNIASKVVKDPNGSEAINFVYEPSLPGKNKIKIEGKTPYTISLSRDPKDTTVYISKLLPGGTNLVINQNIDLTTGLYVDPKTKRLMTRVTTTYPNLTFNEINSFEIVDNPETRKALKSARKEFGLGLNIGYGISGNQNGLAPGFYVGLGLHYSPKFLQFGK